MITISFKIVKKVFSGLHFGLHPRNPKETQGIPFKSYSEMPRHPKGKLKEP